MSIIIYGENKISQWLPLWGVQNNGEGVQENLLRVMGMVYVWVGIWVAWMLAFAKNDQTLTLNI